ncbi:hypothetical protein E2320_002528, partial [Naja naja]
VGGLPNVRNYWVANQLKVVPDIIALTRTLIWRDTELKELREIELWNKWRYQLMPRISPLTLVVEMEEFPKIELKEWISKLKEIQKYKWEDWKNKIKNVTQLRNVLSDIKLNWLNLEKWIKIEERFEEKDRQLTKFETIIKECEVNEEYIGKGRIGKIYGILTELEEQAKGLKLIWESN